MTNLTKAIAALGVVAGLGVAALPLTSYAETTPVVWGDEGNFTKDTDWGSDEAGNKWVKTDVGVTLEVTEGLQIWTNGTDNTPVEMTEADGQFKSAEQTVSVKSNNQYGYTLSIKGITPVAEGASNAVTDMVTTDGHKIAAITTPYTTGATNALALADDGSSVWGYSLDGTNFFGVKTSDTTIKKTTEVVSDATDKPGISSQNITFGAVVSADQEAGVYNGKVTFTATANPKPNAEIEP